MVQFRSNEIKWVSACRPPFVRWRMKFGTAQVCSNWCSRKGYCGGSNAYKSGGTDCSGCESESGGSEDEQPTPSGCPSRCSTCKEGGSADGGIPLDNGKCTAWCSGRGYCGTRDVYKNGGTDCSTCPTSPPSPQPTSPPTPPPTPPTSAFAKKMLDEHNKRRCINGAPKDTIENTK